MAEPVTDPTALTSTALQHLVAGESRKALIALINAEAALRAQLARKHLTAQFDKHSEAVFTREANQIDPELIALTPAEGADVPTYDATAQAGAPEWMNPEQWQAVVEAEQLFALSGHETAFQTHGTLDEDQDSVTYRLPLR